MSHFQNYTHAWHLWQVWQAWQVQLMYQVEQVCLVWHVWHLWHVWHVCQVWLTIVLISGCRRTRSFSLDINEEMNVVRGRHRITMASASSSIPPVRHFGLSYSSSVDISTTTVPEDTELNCTNSGNFFFIFRYTVLFFEIKNK